MSGRLKRRTRRARREQWELERGMWLNLRHEYGDDLTIPIQASILADQRPWLRRSFGCFVAALDA